MRSVRIAHILAIPLALLLLLTVVIPGGIFLVYSFFTFEFGTRQPGMTTGHYTAILGDQLYRKAAWNTLIIACGTTVASVVLGFALAYYLAFRARATRNLILGLIVLSMLASFLVRVYAWRTILGENGVLNTFLEQVGLISEPLNFFLFSRLAVIIAQVNVALPFTTLVLYLSMLGISSDLRESALDLGASRAETLVRIVLPLTGPALLGASALTFFVSAGDFITPVFLGGTNSVTFGTTISDQLRVNLDYGLGSALSFTLVLGFALFYLLLRLAMKRLRLLPASEAGV